MSGGERDIYRQEKKSKCQLKLLREIVSRTLQPCVKTYVHINASEKRSAQGIGVDDLSLFIAKVS